jgi:hypothetical protein
MKLVAFNSKSCVDDCKNFNMLPVTVKMLEDRNQFVCKIKKILNKDQYYDMNEFFNCKFDM